LLGEIIIITIKGIKGFNIKTGVITKTKGDNTKTKGDNTKTGDNFQIKGTTKTVVNKIGKIKEPVTIRATLNPILILRKC
jgi:hypothetical protein